MRNYVSGSAAPGERVAVLTPETTFQLLDGMQAAAHAEEPVSDVLITTLPRRSSSSL
jgi:hypothetical protein